MSVNEEQRTGYYTAVIQPPPQTTTTTFKFSTQSLTEAKITLKDVVDFARQEKFAKENENGELNLNDDTVVKTTNGVTEVHAHAHIGHIAWWVFYPCTGSNKPPIIAMHGGPAFTHKYMLPLKLMAYPEFGGYPVIFYDQCGCGSSTKITKTCNSNNGVDDTPESNVVPPHLLTVEYYIHEFISLLKGWDASESFQISFKNGYYTYGSSWGSMLAEEVAVYMREKMDGDGECIEGLPVLLGMILDGTLADDQFHDKSLWKYRVAQLPSLSYHLLQKLEELGKDDSNKSENENENPPPDPVNWYASKSYKTIEQALNSMFLCRLVPSPDFFNECFESANLEIYAKLQGCSEFSNDRGVLMNWCITDRLSSLSKPTKLKTNVVVALPLPVLVLVGEFDTMTVECSQHVLDAISGGEGHHGNKLVVIPRAGHIKLIDEPLACCEQIVKFIDSLRR